MYSGTTLNKTSGGFIGVHQKIDPIARRNLDQLPGVGPGFPAIKEILAFEGDNGPDGLKRKSPSADEPWHYIDPSKSDDRQLVTMILDHQHNLVEALRYNNHERAAFEAAWLSHAIVDGLTPAHHYPLGEKIEELWGKPKEERLTIKEKNFIVGETRLETLSKNWEYWGAKGVFMTHAAFEFGVAAAAKTSRYPQKDLDHAWLAQATAQGLEQVFLDAMHEVYSLDMYHTFWNEGWTTKLARQTRRVLLPTIIQVVMFAWYEAYRKAEL